MADIELTIDEVAEGLGKALAMEVMARLTAEKRLRAVQQQQPPPPAEAQAPTT